MFLGRERAPLPLEQPERRDQLFARLGGLDDLVDEAVARGDVRIREILDVLRNLLGPRVRSVLFELPAIEDVDRALGTHHRDFRRRIGKVEIGGEILRSHHAIRAAVGLASDDGHLGNRRLGERVEQLRAVPDDPAVLLLRAGQEAGHVLEDDQRDIEGVAEPDEAGALDGGVDVEHSGEMHRLIRDDPHGPPRQPDEADQEIPGKRCMHLEELAGVRDSSNELRHVIRLVGLFGNEAVGIDDGGAVFALADMTAQRQRLAKSQPALDGKAMLDDGTPQDQHIDARIETAG